ncbi:MAG TPA: glycoside hydrolase family 16 protein [Pseudonocardia sp.]|nr:glycoside hydrolase family 16 protein [Pseudonocardia sp.]
MDEFEGSLGENWSVYDGPGHAGNGRRTPDAVSVQDGILTITGDSAGNTAGMAWNPGQKYGRWEGRVRAPASDESYNALLLLWPDAENFPVGGEIDFMEMMDHTRQTTNIFLHYGENNDQVEGEVRIDATQWHNWAVEWTPTHVAAFVDGREWWRTTDVDILPPGPMHLCIQLDWFPDGGDVQESYMYVDWVKQYSLDMGEVVDDVERTVDEVGDAGRAVDGIGDVGRVVEEVRDAGRVVGGIGDVAGAAVNDLRDGPAPAPARGVIRSLTEGTPDPVPPPRAPADRPVPAPGG